MRLEFMLAQKLPLKRGWKGPKCFGDDSSITGSLKSRRAVLVTIVPITIS
jgi:hypothetical protein